MRFSKLRPCDECGGGLGIVFCRVTCEQHVIDLSAARLRHGLDTMFPGHPQIAAAFHDSERDTTVASSNTLLFCTECAANKGFPREEPTDPPPPPPVSVGPKEPEQ